VELSAHYQATFKVLSAVSLQSDAVTMIQQFPLAGKCGCAFVFGAKQDNSRCTCKVIIHFDTSVNTGQWKRRHNSEGLHLQFISVIIKNGYYFVIIKKTWMEGEQAAMTTRNFETDQWRNREEWRLVSRRRRQLLKNRMDG
jgi:hypothetical protein